MRLKLVIAYDGSKFFGSQQQRQHNQTVNNQLELALKRINISTKIVASGRTDTHVHATKQVIHIDVPNFWTDTHKLQHILNQTLQPAIFIRSITIVDETFHARFSAKKRQYRYIFSTKPLSPFQSPYLAHFNSIDFSLLDQALENYIGTYDFSYFMKTGGGQKSAMRTIFTTKRYRVQNREVLFFEANSYVRSQIRYMVGMAIAVAQKRLPFEAISQQLTLEKKHTIVLAPPNGLYLSNIIY
jgi:tRNA pseudouridine38-40 synthase